MNPPQVISVWVCRNCASWFTFPSPHCCAAPDAERKTYVLAEIQ